MNRHGERRQPMDDMPCARRSCTSTLAATDLILLLVAGLVTAVCITVHTPTPVPPDEVPSVTITVGRGETLWAIAKRHRPPDRSVAATVELITTMNGRSVSTLHEGDVLRVPSSQGERSAQAAAR